MSRRRCRAGVAFAAVFLTLTLFTACRPPEPSAVAPVPTAVAEIAPTITSTPTSVAPTATVPPTATPSPTPTPAPTDTPTPLPPVTLVVPPEWEAAARSALDALQAEGAAGWAWEIIVRDDPAGAPAQVALNHDAAGTVVRREPLALVVPFTANWQATIRADADAILANGHRLATPVRWSDVDRTQKALRVDGLHPTDPGYPYQDSWSLAAAPGFEQAVSELAPYLQAAMAPEPFLRLAAVGDLMLDRSLGYVITQGLLAYPFERVAPYFQAADYVVGNLESALGTIGEPAPKRYPFRAPPEAAASLAISGFDLVSLANNHAQDYGPEALLQGIGLLHEQGVATIGAGANEAAAYAPHFAEVNGLKLAFLGYVHVPIEASTNFDVKTWEAIGDNPGLAWGDPERIRADVAAARPQADLVVVVLHSGYEYIEEPSLEQAAAARAAVEAGADLVIGHHAHILQGVQNYRDGVIIYGLGNFAFEIEGPPETAIANVWLDADGVRQVELIPAIVQERGQPRLAEPWEAGPILERVHYLSILLNAQTETP